MNTATKQSEREKNKARQRKYKESLKTKGVKKLNLVVKEETYDTIKKIAEHSGISQGEVINRMFDIKKEGIMSQVEEAEKGNETKEVDVFQFENFRLRELAISTMATMLGKTSTMIITEEDKTFPDKKKLEQLEERYLKLSDEQRRVYFGDLELMQQVIDEYSPEIKKWFDEAKADKI